MALRYDFDIIPVFDTQESAEGTGSSDAENARESGNSKLAMFREPATVEALCAAPTALREMMEAAGFGLAAQDSPLPADRYEADQEDDRIALILRLTEHVRTTPLPAEIASGENPDGSEFDFDAFVQHLDRALPCTAADVDRIDAQRQEDETEARSQSWFRRLTPGRHGSGQSRLPRMAAGLLLAAGLIGAAPFLADAVLPLVELSAVLPGG